MSNLITYFQTSWSGKTHRLRVCRADSFDSRESGHELRRWFEIVWTYQSLVAKVWKWVIKIWTPIFKTFRTLCPDFCFQFWYGQTFRTHDATHVQTFQTQILGATMLIGSRTGCCALQGAILTTQGGANFHIQTLGANH